MIASSPLVKAVGPLLFIVVVAAAAGPVVRWALHRRDKHAVADDLRLLIGPTRALALCLIIGLVTSEVLGAIEDGDIDPDWLPAWLPDALNGLGGPLTIATVGSATWLVARLLTVFERAMFRRLRIDVADNLRARSRRTQLRLVTRILTVFVWATATVVGALTFEAVRELGPALVAYAGVIGVILGLALRSPLESMMYGLMVAVNEPIRLDDVVVIDGEFGHVEEINLSHVVLQLWDKRRLVLPTSRFVSETFENWTRRDSDLIGSVHLHTDYGAPIAELREELERIVHASPLWDGNTCVLQVVELGEQSVKLRALISAASAAAAWDLRCHVREQLLPLLATTASTPRLRAAALDHQAERGGAIEQVVSAASRANQTA